MGRGGDGGAGQSRDPVAGEDPAAPLAAGPVREPPGGPAQSHCHTLGDTLDQAESGDRRSERDGEKERQDRVGELGREVVGEGDPAERADVLRQRQPGAA